MTHSRRSFIGGLTAISTLAAMPLSVRGVAKEAEVDETLTQFVKLEIGTGGFGHTSPAATVPFGAVQLGPDTGDYEWKHCSGYHYDDNEILGFSHTHLSGTGVGDMLDFRVTPGYAVADPSRFRPEDFIGRFSHNEELSEPGYYSVHFKDSNITTELTATERVGYHRYTFQRDHGCLLINLEPVWRFKRKQPNQQSLVLSSSLNIGQDTIAASRSTDGWAKGREIHCSMKFSRPFSRVDVYQDGRLLDNSQRQLSGKQLWCVVHFESTSHEAVELKTGISGVSTEGAALNLHHELSGWNFTATRRAALARWQKELSRAVVTSNDLRSKEIFYTGLYHTMLAPTLFDDVDGRYMGMDAAIHVLPTGRHNYSTFSLWDTYRALHPMYTLAMPEKVSDIVDCIVRQSTESPAGVTVWPLQGKETGCMVGYHSAPVVAEALVKGFQGIDAKAAYAAFRKRAEMDDYRGLAAYRKYGYVPCDLQDESASKTCDYAYDDWCVAAIAEVAGDVEEAARLRRRSRSYQNLYDKVSGFIRPRYSDGRWASPFNPKSTTVTKWRDYTEANGWETTFLAQHDGSGLVDLFGGKAALEKKLDDLFNQSSDLPPDAPDDMTGMVGQYCQGNEPCHHVAYFYNEAGAPHKTQKRIHQILTELYDNKPDGMAGNEDCGQMSAWYCINALGFYAVDPVSAKYDIGTPLFDNVVLRVGDGRKLSIETRRESAQSIYVKSVQLNGQIQSGWKLSHRDLAMGGVLVFELADNIS
jgi:predicted alpha-1,2-mannosidase